MARVRSGWETYLSSTASSSSQANPLGADPELDDLLSGITEFAQAEIGRRTTAHEVPLTAPEITAIELAAEQMGLLDPDPEGFGLWASESSAATVFATSSLRVLARESCAAALALHLTALARMAVRFTGLQAPAAETKLAPSGRFGLGGASLGRWLAGHGLSARDEAILADNFGSGQRCRWTADAAGAWITPLYSDGTMQLVCLNGGGEADPAPHGLDGLLACTQPASPAEADAVIEPERLAALLAAYQLGLVAIAQGAADVAVRRAAEYAGDRRQGGTAIAAHDAVALMLADQWTAIRSAQAQVRAAAGSALSERLPDAIGLRLAVLPALFGAADTAVQVHGGSGYMRDTGVEHLLRDIGALRAIGGAPDDLRLLLAALVSPGAANDPATGSEQQIAGHVPATSALSPQPGFRAQPILRVMSAYEALDPWERDTRSLPRALRERRRELRAFAETHLEPLAPGLDLTMRDEHGERPELNELLRTAGRAGLLSDLLPWPLGSVPAPRFRTSLVLQQALRTEELARVDGGLMLYLSAHNLGLSPVLFSGNRHAYRDVALPAMRACMNGEPQIFAFAITEPGAGSDAEDGHGAELSKPGLVASRSPGGWKLSGSKSFISGGDIARWVVAFAALEDEGFDSWTAFLVDTRSAGFSVMRTEVKMGMRASGAAALAFDDCFVPDELVLGGLRGGWALNRATLNFSRLPVAGMSVGFAQRATEIATTFACQQRLAGRPLIDHQYVQLAIADMQAETAAIRSLVWQFARARVPEQAKASLAKFHAGDRAQIVIERAIGLLGEHGLLHEPGLERIFRDNRVTRIFEGTNQINRLAVIEDQQQWLLAEAMRNDPAGPRKGNR